MRLIDYHNNIVFLSCHLMLVVMLVDLNYNIMFLRFHLKLDRSGITLSSLFYISIVLVSSGKESINAWMFNILVINIRLINKQIKFYSSPIHLSRTSSSSAPSIKCSAK